MWWHHITTAHHTFVWYDCPPTGVEPATRAPSNVTLHRLIDTAPHLDMWCGTYTVMAVNSKLLLFFFPPHHISLAFSPSCSPHRQHMGSANKCPMVQVANGHRCIKRHLCFRQMSCYFVISTCLYCRPFRFVVSTVFHFKARQLILSRDIFCAHRLLYSMLCGLKKEKGKKRLMPNFSRVSLGFGHDGYQNMSGRSMNSK